MKRVILIVISLLSFSLSQSQNDTAAFRKDLRTLISDAQNEFMINQGILEYDDTVSHKKYFTPKTNLGSTQSFIQQQTDAQGTYKTMVASYSLSETAGLTRAVTYLPIILDELNKMHSSGKFKGRDYKDNGVEVTELTDSEGNYIMELLSSADAVTLRLYAKSWGKR